MYLKSLDIQGFKSFPAPTHLAFDKPITAIVGPNGSGKSNIADALLWVMGEQSPKTLRGGKMEDVIFGGTLTRPGQNFAEVSLILDNSDGSLKLDTNEVMLTRRYYRSGESEYFINQSSAKLKEITELLMDTGLGREGYSVIGQGKISDILSTKSKDRREIFEEAAGISRYRHNKEEAERKLQRTEENLVRIGDRISELEFQYEPLKEQAEKAKRYELLKGELRGIEISLWLKELETVNERTQKTEGDLLSAKRDFDAAQQEYDEILAQQDSLSEMTMNVDIQAQSARELIAKTREEKNEIEKEVSVQEQQLEGNIGQIEYIRSELKSDEDKHGGVGTEIDENEKRLEELSRLRAQKNEQISKLDKELENIVSTSTRGEDKHRELIQSEQKLQAQLSEKKSELSALAAGAQELYDAEEERKQKLADAKGDIKTRENEHVTLNEELEKAKEEVVSLENVIKGLELKVENRTKKAADSGEVFERLSSELKTMQTRQTLLSDMERDFNGYSKAVQTIMQEHSRGNLRNIHGTVASLVKTDDLYTKAIETALGFKINDIIVDTEEDGKAAINMLARRNCGRATFQPISTVKARNLNESEFKNDEGFLGLAINLVRYDKKYAGIYSNLLGHVLICEDLTCAIAIARKHGHRYRIVTLDGQVMNAGGSMTGGSAVEGVGILTRANELSKLAGRIEACKEELEKAERIHSECTREKTAAEYERDTARDELRALHESVKIKEIEKEHREQNIENANILIATLNEEIAAFEERIKNNTTSTESLKIHITKLEAQLETKKLEIDEAIKDNENVKAERERITDERGDIRSEISAYDAETEAVKNAMEKLRERHEEMSDSLQNKLETIAKLENENEQIRNAVKEKRRKIDEIQEKLKSQEEQLNSIDTGKLEIEAKRSKIGSMLKEKGDKKDARSQKVHDLDMKLEKIKGEEALIVQSLWESYELMPQAAKKHGTPIESVSAAKKRKQTIKKEVDSLGTVNIGAIAEFARVSERYEFFTSQRDDILKAKGELLGIIDEIISRMREIFLREFDIINESFKKTFRELFGGGRAALILEDPEDVLNCGIEIEAQPPGKALKTISLLSGGEQAFVAIAIYYAILAVRPPPFVVMDEIDAALDEANVNRFAEYMRYMSEKSQMIVITHKRGTMEEADVLYGITMQELGVSNILCIDLNEAEKHIKSKVNA